MRFPHYCLAAALLAGGAPSLAAQIRASELASVSQTVDGTEIKVEYSRPRARGRDSLFGGEVKWNEVWTPGANYATTLEINRDIKLEGHPVPKGKYSLWLVVKPSGPWTMVLDPRSHLFHMAHPDSAANQIRFPVETRASPSTEVLTWTFPEVRVNGATLLFAWGRVQIPFRIDVTPTYNVQMTASQAGPYVGRYSFAWTAPEPADSLPITLTISFQDSALYGEFKPELWPGAGKILMIPVKPDWFLPAFLEKGEIYDVEKTMMMEFPRTKPGQKAVSFEVRGTGDSLWATGKRK